MIISDETTIRLNIVKGLVWKLPEEKKVVRIARHSTKVNVWGCLSSQDFGRIVRFKRNFNAELMCDIYKRGTAQKQSVLDSTIRELQGENDAKHTRKVALNWKTSSRIQKINWPSISLLLYLLKMFGSFSR